jgi:hypothetical protein
LLFFFFLPLSRWSGCPSAWNRAGCLALTDVARVTTSNSAQQQQAMATTFHNHAQGHQGRISKYKARSTVKPILKKLHSSHSEKNSLDLDRGWEEQHTQLGYTNRTSHDNQSSADALFGQYSPTTFQPPTGRGTRDVSFDLSTADLMKASTTITTGTTTTTCSTLNSTSATSASSSTAAFSSNGNSSNNNNNNASNPTVSSSKLPYHHTRSTSGTSQFSVATSNSGRNGSFVHPFQQTPRTSSPPLLSYAASLASVDNNPQRDYPPNTISEDDDNLDPPCIPISTTGSSGARVYQSSLSQSQSHSSHRGPPPAGNQRASSMSDAIPTIRTAHGRTSSGSIPRLMTTTTNNSTDASPSIHGRATETGHFGNITPSVTVVDESPLSAVTSAAFGMSPQMSTGTSSSNHPMSPLRSSLDMTNFRIRSRSDVDTATRQEHVRAARRKFEEKEKAKEEKYAREQSRKRERADSKEAHRLEKAQSRNRGSHSARNSSSDARPSFTRKSTNHSRLDEQDEKISLSGADQDLSGRLYEDTAPAASSHPRADDVHFESSKRNRSGKRKSTGTWTAFVLWLRTRLLKLGRR